VSKRRGIFYIRTIKRKKASCPDNIMHGDCLVKHVIEGKIEEEIEVMGRKGRRRKQLLDDLRKREVTGN
jgi:hypothetical protein